MCDGKCEYCYGQYAHLVKVSVVTGYYGDTSRYIYMVNGDAGTNPSHLLTQNSMAQSAQAWLVKNFGSCRGGFGTFAIIVLQTRLDSLRMSLKRKAEPSSVTSSTRRGEYTAKDDLSIKHEERSEYESKGDGVSVRDTRDP